jgi:glycosyltransferase involved in cell wall biosynthesis
MIHNRYRILGGEDVSTREQLDLLRSAGHEVVLLEDSNERVDELGMIRTAAGAVWSAAARRRVGAALAESRFDLMHVQNFFPLFSPAVYYAAQEHGVPVVQSLRNFRQLCPEGMLHRNGAVCTDCVGKAVAWPGIWHSCYRGSARGSAAIAAMATTHRWAGTWARRVACYVAPSEFARNVYVAGGWDGSKIEVIPNFVFPDPQQGPGDGGFALFVGRLAAVKGLDTLLEAWQQGGVDFPLRIVGDGPLRSQVQEVAETNPNVDYLGVKDHSDVVRLMGDASLVVVPTRGIESFGRVVVESMARGTPAVVADHGGLAEVVSGSGAGLLFPPGDAATLADRVRQLIADVDRLAAMRLIAREVYLERYTGDVALNRWMGLYASVIGG